jgi:hypothetical protein
MTDKTYTQAEVNAMMAEMDAIIAEMAEEVAKQRARADAAEEALRLVTQATRDNAATVSQKCMAFAACVPYAELRCRQQHLTAANIFYTR